MKIKRDIKENKALKKNDEEPNQDLEDSFFDIEKFLHEPNRLQIIAFLYNIKEIDMVYLKNNMDITWGSLSFHISKLEEKDYIVVEKSILDKKPYTLLKISKKGIDRYKKYVEAMKKFIGN